jgi:ABC-type Fe3+ transport system permease subunit
MLLAFWESVAVGTVSGLIVVAISGAVAWAVRRRGQRNRWAFQEYLNRAPLRAD